MRSSSALFTYIELCADWRTSFFSDSLKTSHYEVIVLLLEDLSLVFKGRKDHWDQGRSRLNGPMRGKPGEQWSDLSLCSQVRLTIVLSNTRIELDRNRCDLLWNLETLFKSLYHVCSCLFLRWLLQLRVLLLPLFFKLHPLWDVEGIRPEETVNFLFQLRNVGLIECVL